jgi:hypothetical protein
MKKMKGSLLISGISCVLLLAGCTETGSSGDKKLSDEYVESAFTKLSEENSTKLPENVENGTVSEDMYSEAMRFITEFTENEQNMLEFQDRLNKDSSLNNDDEFIDKYKESMDSYEVFIKGFHLSPSTEVDFEIENNLSDALLYTSYIISALRQYIDTGDTYHISSLEENMNKRNTSYTALTNTIKKHELYIEE